ncbi:MAG: mycofactocin biosynthesis glycosyltransferase MftF [Actinomycetota bacterium]
MNEPPTPLTARAPLPAGTVLHADGGLRLRNGGRVLLGGGPLRFVRLTAPGARTLRSWLAGESPTSSGPATRLARRLLDAGMVHPRPPDHVTTDALTVVVPVKNDLDGAHTTLSGLPAGTRVIVVDDGSDEPVEAEHLPEACRIDQRCEIVRRPRSGGPGVARIAGLERVTTPLVAFVDAGVDVGGDALERLTPWFTDPEVTAVAPRVRSAPGDDAIAHYETTASPLDLGPNPSPVGPGRPVSYVPTACVVVRRSALDTVGGFDPSLRYGEDVDLVWRLSRASSVRYDPSVEVTHPARPTLGALARQRFGYGTAAGPLALRHGGDLAPVRMSAWSAAVVALGVLGRPLAALGLGVGTAVALAPKLEPLVPDHHTEAALLTARGHAWAARSVADAAVRVWWPLPVLAALLGWGRPLRLAWAFALLRRLLAADGGPRRRAQTTAIGVADDLAYGTGVWVGAVRARAPEALLPRFMRWP